MTQEKNAQVAKIAVGNEKFVELKDSMREQELVMQIQMQCEVARRTLLKVAYNLGKMLTESKQFIKHGEWDAWVKERLPFGSRAAQQYMKVFKEYDENEINHSDVFSAMGYTQAVALLAVPAEEREDFAREVNAKDMTIKELQDTIKNMQSQQMFKDKELENLKAENEKLQKRSNGVIEELENMAKHIDTLEAMKTQAEENKEEEFAKRLDERLANDRQMMKKLESEKKELGEKLTALQKEQDEKIAKVREEEKAKHEKELAKKGKEVETATRNFNKKIEELKEKNSMQTARAKEAEEPANLDKAMVKAEVFLTGIKQDEV